MLDREKQIFKVTVFGSIINTVLVLFKFVAGILGRSSAMIADAVHSLSDFATDIIVLVFVKISGKPKDESHDYGHGKFETLATTIIGVALFAVAVGIICGGAMKIALWLRGEQLQSPGLIALWAAIVSIVLKELTFHITIRRGRELDSQAVVANAWHHRSDAFSSVGTAVGIGAAALLGPRWAVMDPLASVVVGAFIVKVSITLLKDGINDLLEVSLPPEVEDEILAIISSYNDVSQPHNLKTRRIGNDYAIEVHVRMDGDLPLSLAHDRATDIENALKEKYGAGTHVGIHVEPVLHEEDEQV